MSKRLFIGLTIFLSALVAVNIYADRTKEGGDSKLENFSRTIYVSIKE